jgi:hypothetical protein
MGLHKNIHKNCSVIPCFHVLRHVNAWSERCSLLQCLERLSTGCHFMIEPLRILSRQRPRVRVPSSPPLTAKNLR